MDSRYSFLPLRPIPAVPPPSWRKAPDSRRTGWRQKVTLIVFFGLAMSGCGTAAFSAHDLRLEATNDTLYIFARSEGVSRNLCASLGGDLARAEGQWAAADGNTIQLGRVEGCYTVRHIIVCSEGDAACLTHEERHKREGAFHP